jgi:hypothetical protein
MVIKESSDTDIYKTVDTSNVQIYHLNLIKMQKILIMFINMSEITIF